jgi:hypothetical protein
VQTAEVALADAPAEDAAVPPVLPSVPLELALDPHPAITQQAAAAVSIRHPNLGTRYLRCRRPTLNCNRLITKSI